MLILRTASNYTRPGAGKPVRIVFADGGAEAGFRGRLPGRPRRSVKALVAGWDRYGTTLPKPPPKATDELPATNDLPAPRPRDQRRDRGAGRAPPPS